MVILMRTKRLGFQDPPILEEEKWLTQINGSDHGIVNWDTLTIVSPVNA